MRFGHVGSTASVNNNKKNSLVTDPDLSVCLSIPPCPILNCPGPWALASRPERIRRSRPEKHTFQLFLIYRGATTIL
jgi:hypothetical protein